MRNTKQNKDWKKSPHEKSQFGENLSAKVGRSAIWSCFAPQIKKEWKFPFSEAQTQTGNKIWSLFVFQPLSCAKIRNPRPRRHRTPLTGYLNSFARRLAKFFRLWKLVFANDTSRSPFCTDICRKFLFDPLLALVLSFGREANKSTPQMCCGVHFFLLHPPFSFWKRAPLQ